MQGTELEFQQQVILMQMAFGHHWLGMGMQAGYYTRALEGVPCGYNYNKQLFAEKGGREIIHGAQT